MPETIPQLVDQELDELIRSAIMQRNLLRFTYKGNERIAEPHDYGIQNGIVRVFCFQVAGRKPAHFRDGVWSMSMKCKTTKSWSNILPEIVRLLQVDIIGGMKSSSGSDRLRR